MHQPRPSGARYTPQPWRWALPTLMLAVLIGASRAGAQPPAPQPNHHPAARPFREPPRRLSETEVAHALATRHQGMRERFLAHQERRRQQLRDDYGIAQPPATADDHPRPDAPGGEFNAEGVR